MQCGAGAGGGGPGKFVVAAKAMAQKGYLALRSRSSEYVEASSPHLQELAPALANNLSVVIHPFRPVGVTSCLLL